MRSSLLELLGGMDAAYHSCLRVFRSQLQPLWPHQLRKAQLKPQLTDPPVVPEELVVQRGRQRQLDRV